MGESYPRCVLTGEKIWDEAVAFLVGPQGYGPHDVPPTPVGSHLSFSENVHHWPLTLPVRVCVGPTWGEIRHVYGPREWLIIHRRKLGVSLKHMLNYAVNGRFYSPGFHAAAQLIYERNKRTYGNFENISDEDAEAKVGAAFDNGLNYAGQTLNDWQKSQGKDYWVQLYLQMLRSSRNIAKNNIERSWRAQWADIVYVHPQAWKHLCAPAKPRGAHSAPEIEDPKTDWENVARHSYDMLCEYSVLTYREFLQHPYSLLQQRRLSRLITCLSVMSGTLAPPPLHDGDYEQNRIAVTKFMYTQDLNRKREREKYNGPE